MSAGGSVVFWTTDDTNTKVKLMDAEVDSEKVLAVYRTTRTKKPVHIPMTILGEFLKGSDRRGWDHEDVQYTDPVSGDTWVIVMRGSERESFLIMSIFRYLFGEDDPPIELPKLVRDVTEAGSVEHYMEQSS